MYIIYTCIYLQVSEYGECVEKFVDEQATAISELQGSITEMAVQQVSTVLCQLPN